MASIRYTQLRDKTRVVASQRTGRALRYATRTEAEEACALIAQHCDLEARPLRRSTCFNAHGRLTTGYFIEIVGQLDTASHMAELFGYHQGARETV